jgi:hypothetical protein
MIKFFNMPNEDLKLNIGDYVICSEISHFNEPDSHLYNNVLDFISNNVGQICDVENNYKYTIKYFNVPLKIKGYFCHRKDIKNSRDFYREEILYASKDREEVELKLLSIKYNI